MKANEITSIGVLVSHKGGKNLTPIFKGSQFPIFVYVTNNEFDTVKDNKKLMKKLVIKKIKEKEFKTYSEWIRE